MVEYVKLNDDRKIPCSIVIFATGVKPNVDVPKKAGIELGNTGAIKVDTHMQTSMPGIYAAGDCAETLDALSRKWFYFPVGSIAAKEAIIAGKNVAGKEIEGKGVIRTQMDALFGINIISIGHTSESARDIGVMAKTVELTSIQRRLRSLDTHALAMATIDDKDRVIGMQIMASRFTSWYSFKLLKAIEMSLTLNRFLDKWPPITNLSQAGLWRVGCC
jgi:pyruvate/2-oxoglutarate dehydrogenase complex dihydrolipoamide dehydrogenase (E3) component